MSKRLLKSLSYLLIITLILTNVLGFGNMNVVRAEASFIETFDNLDLSGTAYTEGEFIGNNNIKWFYKGARGDLDTYAIDGHGIMLRRVGDNGKIYAPSIAGGIGNFSVELKKAFTSTAVRTVELLINDESKGTFTIDQSINEVQLFSVNNINVEGTFKLEIRHISGGTSSGAQVVIDNITWTTYGSGGANKVLSVMATPDSGEVDENTQVALSTMTNEATIYYAISNDGEYSEYTEYVNPIVITEDMTIKAYASKDEMEDSDISEFSYTVKREEILNISDAKLLPNGDIVKVKGIVTGMIGNNPFIQDDTAGIYIYVGGNARDEFAVGNEVIVRGPLDEFNNLKQISNPNLVQLISEGNDLPAPKEVTIDQINEDLEGQLVKISNVTITKVFSDDKNNSSITVSDGIKSIDLRVDRFNEALVPISRFNIGDVVSVIAPVGQFKTSYQLMLRTIDDVDFGPDTVAPVINHTPITEGNVNKNLSFKATVTDDRKVASVKLYYRTIGETEYTAIDMALELGEYFATIAKEELNTAGLEYYIETTDGTNIVTVPVDPSNPYQVTISDGDILGPIITALYPADGAILEETNTKPGIRAEFEDESGIDTDSVRLLLNGVDVISGATVQADSVSYVPDEDISKGTHIVTVEVSDILGNKTAKTWTFTIGEEEYKFYRGQLHSHTTYSDGRGTGDDAFTWARDQGKADFFAITDHSNWFDNDRNSENITDVSQSTSNTWKSMHRDADKYNEDGKFVAMAGYEMTWSGSTGGWGHINTFNTQWFASRTNSAMDLPTYYQKLANDAGSISQLNHPGKTFGDFADFGYYSEAADRVVTLIEVGNGEGPIRGSGYFPSYEYYTRALDKGWHVAPTNNQDNHKAAWVTANEARVVAISTELTRDSIYQAMRDMRIYAAEDKNIDVMFKINGEMMGSSLNEPETLNVSISIKDPDEHDIISKVELISDGGVVSASKTFDSNVVDWKFDLEPKYSYYYVRVTQADRDIIVTAPIWTAKMTPVGISNIAASQKLIETNTSVKLDATVFNNAESILSNAKVEFYVNEVKPENKIGEDTVTNVTQGATAIASMNWTPTKAGTYSIYATTTINVDGVDKVFTVSINLEVKNKEDIIKVVIDASHANHYVSGSYAGKMVKFKEVLEDSNMIVVENTSNITAEVLADAQILVITSPQPTGTSRSKLSDAEIQVVKDFVQRGGSLILTSRADYKDGTGDYQNAVQGNKVLEAIGSNIRMNDDQVVDFTNNEGQEYRLMFNTYTSTKYNLTAGQGIEGYPYSFFSGASVILKENGDDTRVDFLVKGHSTTEISDADNANDFTPVEKGNVYVLAVEDLENGGKVVVSGSTFFSDFEILGDNLFSNLQITYNVMEWLKPQVELPLSTIKEVRDGMPSNFGEKFTIEGRITAESEAYSKANNNNNAFFEVIYVQDETGGITIFGVSNTELPLGTKVRITGVAGEYQGDYQLQIQNESKDLVVLADPIEVVDPKIISTADSMLKSNEGWLVKIQGIVTRIEESSIFINDGTGEARVYLEGYIGDGSGNLDTLGKFDPTIEVGDTVSAIGLASTDPEGPRLRVRNSAEISKVDNAISVEIVSVEAIANGDSHMLKVILNGDTQSVSIYEEINIRREINGVVDETFVWQDATCSWEQSINTLTINQIPTISPSEEEQVIVYYVSYKDLVEMASNEIVINKLEDNSYSIEIANIIATDIDGNIATEFNKGNMVLINANISNKLEEALSGMAIIKLVDSEGRTYAIGLLKDIELQQGETKTFALGFNIPNVKAGKHTAKVYMWNNWNDREPLSEVGSLEFTVK